LPTRVSPISVPAINFSSGLTCSSIGGALLAHAGEPLEHVRTAVDQAIQILKDPNLKSNDKKSERVDRLKKIVNPLFDYEEMAKRALGSHWRKRSSAEQEEFVKVFRDFLERIYSDKIDLYNGEKILFTKERLDQDYAEVDSSVIDQKGEEFSVIYKLRRVEGRWKVYDVVVENISIVNNYRSQFNRVISKSSFEELLKKIREKGA